MPHTIIPLNNGRQGQWCQCTATQCVGSFIAMCLMALAYPLRGVKAASIWRGGNILLPQDSCCFTQHAKKVFQMFQTCEPPICIICCIHWKLESSKLTRPTLSLAPESGVIDLDSAILVASCWKVAYWSILIMMETCKMTQFSPVWMPQQGAFTAKSISCAMQPWNLRSRSFSSFCPGLLALQTCSDWLRLQSS